MRRNPAIQMLFSRVVSFSLALNWQTKDTTSTLMLSQACYWTDAYGDDDGWFVASSKDWTDATGLSKRQQEWARSKLRESGFISESLTAQSPPNTCFKVEVQAILDAMEATPYAPQVDRDNMRLLNTHKDGLIQHARKRAFESTATCFRKNTDELSHARDIILHSNIISSTESLQSVEDNMHTEVSDNILRASGAAAVKEHSTFGDFGFGEDEEGGREDAARTQTSRTATSVVDVPGGTVRISVSPGKVRVAAQPPLKNASAHFIDAFREATKSSTYPAGRTPELGPAQHGSLKRFLAQCGSDETYMAALGRFFRDPWARQQGCPVSILTAGKMFDRWTSGEAFEAAADPTLSDLAAGTLAILRSGK